MNIGSAILPTGSLPRVAGRAALAGLKGPSLRDNLRLNTQDISSESAQKSKTDKKSAFHITNTTDDKVESQDNTTQSTMKDKCRQDAQTRPAQKQDTNLETQLPVTASAIAYSALAGTSDLKTNVDVSAAIAQGLLPTDKANLLNNTAIGNPPAAEQDGPPAVQNNNKETADGSKPAGRDVESQKAKLLQQATEALASQEAARAKDTTVKQTENQITQITSSGNEPKTMTIANLPAASETAYANQSGNGLSNEEQAEKTEGKNNPSKNKLQQINSLQNQQTDAQKSSNNITNKTQTLQSDDQKGFQIQTNDKDSGGKEQIPLNNNQPIQNDRKISSAEQASKDSQTFKLPSDLSGQIQESAKALLQANKGQITVRLNPPELGSICLKVSDKGDQISGLLQVTRPETQHELQQFLPEILRNLEDAGISIKRFEVVLNNPSDQQTLQQYPYQQNNQQSYNPGTETQAGYQSFNYLFNDPGRYQQVGAVQTVGAGAGSLNILM